MSQLVDAVFALSVFTTVALTALGIGFESSMRVWEAAKTHRTELAKVVVANTVMIPLIGVITVNVVPVDTAGEIGLLLCAICAAGPLGLKTSQIARADLAWALTLMVVLLLMNLVSLPLWTGVVLERSVSLRPGELVGVLVLSLLVPFVLGALIRLRYPDFAQRAVPKTVGVSNLALVLAVLTGVGGSFGEVLDAFSSWTLLAIGVILFASGAFGFLVRADGPVRSASFLITLNRAVSLALLVASRAFPNDPRLLTTVVAFGAVQTVVVVAFGVLIRSSPASVVAPSPRFVD